MSLRTQEPAELELGLEGLERGPAGLEQGPAGLPTGLEPQLTPLEPTQLGLLGPATRPGGVEGGRHRDSVYPS